MGYSHAVVGGLGLGSQGRPCMRLAMLVILVTFLSVFYFFSDVTSVGYMEIIRRTSEFDQDFYYNTGPATYFLDPTDNQTRPKEGYLVWNPSCRIPDIDPWHESIRKLIKHSGPVICSSKPPLTQLRGDKLVLLRDRLKIYGSKTKCCYQQITRKDAERFSKKVDDVYSLSTCERLEDSITLRSDQEFIMVKCVVPKIWKDKEVYTNFHARTPVRPEIEPKLQRNITPENKKLSVLLIGIDSISRLNLIRTMPKTVNFLRRAGWVEMKGYNKMDDNTFPNLMAILTGLEYKAVRETCMKSPKDPVDSCPFIWKNYSKEGYITGYAEDEPSIGSFNFAKTGFFKTPTDYYLRPFMLAAEKYSKISKKDGMNACLGPTLATDYIYQYATDFSKTFKDHLYFSLFWMNALSHSNVNTPFAMDNRNLEFLEDISKNGVLNNTLVVFLSDHGMRFGKIRETYVGWLEERLPFIYIWVPEWFRSLYPQKYANLLNNRDKLTSPYDLHLTLQHVLYSEHPNGTFSCPNCLSMFDEIPWNRSCADVGVTEHWCTCSEYKTLSTEGNSVRSMVKFTLNEINNLVKDSKDVASKTKCARLSVRRVLSVRSKVYEHKLGYNEYVVLFETVPGYALFEATVSHYGQFKLLGTVSRINAFGSQSKCMNNAFLKKYCFCKKT